MNAKVTKILTHVVAFFLGAAIGAGVYGVVDNIPRHDISGENPTGNVYDGGLMLGDIEESGVTLTRTAIPVAQYDEYGISPVMENSYMLTATVTPAESIDRDFTWSIKFKNPSSSWASGKNISDYITISPDSSNKLKCIVSCKGAFGEPAEVSITYDHNSSIKATVQVDYVKRVQNVTLSGFSALSFCDSSKSNTLQLTATYGVGTVTGTLKVKSAWGEFSDQLYLNLTGGNEQAGYYFGQAETLNGVDGFDFRQNSKGKAVTTNKLSLNVNSFLGEDIPEANLNYLKAALVEAANAGSEDLRACVEYEYSYATYSSTGTVYTSYGEIDTSKLSNPYTVTGVSVDRNGLYY